MSDSYDINNGTVVLKGPLKEDSNGNYTIIVEIKNDNLKKNKSLNIEIVFSPKISITANSSNVYEGDSLVINCNVSGNPTPTIKWKKNDQDLNFTGSHLQIAKLKKSDDGLYYCFAENSVGSKNKSLNLSVKVKAAITSFENISVIEGREASLICIVRGSPLPNVTIEANDGQFSNSTQVQKTSNTIEISVNISLKNITFGDSGEYICGVTQKDESYLEFNKTAHLKVFAQPFVFINETKVKTVQSTTTDLFCFVHSNQSINVNWFKDGEVVTNKNVTNHVHNDSVTTSILRIDASENMFGNYSCAIVFINETFTAKMELVRLMPPNRPLNVSCIATQDSAELVIFVDASGESEIDSVLYNGSAINPLGKSSLSKTINVTEFNNSATIIIRIPNLKSGTIYSFDLTVKNKAGESELINVEVKTQNGSFANPQSESGFSIVMRFVMATVVTLLIYGTLIMFMHWKKNKNARRRRTLSINAFQNVELLNCSPHCLDISKRYSLHQL
ncbi:neural cell adhesion molecule 1-like isoform X12 [Leptotrombidium deliense]|uniref:Neural cell adhesion molecule 1-like isoform X12 n=1 Tax=Leptotrombidium deliense TaxID=299467 RepID=A0A443SBT7_9ACAR|nr:neural cell adhesion molecule 1-like isoform X12 [Leptotrombidium deliense]